MMKKLLLSKKIGVLLIVMIAVFFVGANSSYGQITTLSAWSNVYNGSGNYSGSLTVGTGTNSNRVLVVGIATSTQTESARTVTITYGGKALTSVNGNIGDVVRQHTQLYYLNESGIDAAIGSTLSFSVSGGTNAINSVFTGLYDNVDQNSPITDSKIYSSGTGTATTFQFATGLTINANNLALKVLSSVRIGSTTARTISNFGSNWTLVNQQTGNYNPTGTANDLGIRNAVGQRSIPSSNTTDISATTMSGATLISMTGLSLKSAFPSLSSTPVSSGFGDVCLNTTVGPQNFTISGTNLTAANVTVSSLTGYTFSTTSGGTYTSSLSLTQTGGTYNQTVFVKFTPIAVQSYDGNIAIGGGGATSVNVSVTGAGITLLNAAITPVPSDAATGVCYDGSGAVNSVSWAAVSGATSYDVYFGAGSLPGSVTSNVPTNSYSTGTLLASTTYYWKVVPKNACGDATGASTWTFTTASSTCLSYCAISATYSRPITRVIFDGVNNTSSNANTTTPSYEDFTSISANVQVGQTYSLTIEGNTWGNSSNVNTYYYSAYIDWNQNGNFSDAGESFQVGTLNSSTGIDGQQTSINIVIPVSASLSNTRMRVIGQFGGYNTNSCAILDGSNSYGQAEDYTLNIIPACATAPVAICKDIAVDLDDTGNVSITGTQVNNGSTSPCGNTLSYAVSPSSFTCANLGSNTVTLTVTDDGNSKTATCTATVTVRDITLPTIANCPANINIEVPFGNSGANVAWTAPTATDNCGVTTFTSNHTSGDFFNLGSTTVTYTAKDNSVNTATCSFAVTVTMADCNPMGINASGQVDWISKIDIGSFSKASAASNYSNFTSDVINLARNTNQTITLTPGVPASGFVEYWKVWIDLNKDGDYLDTGEELYNGNSVSAITSSITIPDVTVNTTMRVAMKGAHTDDLTVPGGNVTAEYYDSPIGEEIDKLIDNIVDVANKSKYLTFHSSGWVQYQFPPGEKYTVTKYSMTSANDSPERDPLNWNLQGSNDGSSWITIDSRSNEDFPTRWLKKEYSFTNTIAYGYYRLNMTNNSGTILQLGEWELFEIDDTPYPEPCETFSFGEVEDYTVNIAPACVDGTLSLTSITGTDAQAVCINTPITSITYAVGGGATGATVTGLPTGVTDSFSAGIITISGSPGASSTYTITTTGTPSPCVEASITGSILVKALPTVSSASVSPTSVCGSGQVTFSATASSGSIKWYDALTGGNEISVLNPTISSTTTYYAEAISSEGCRSAVRTGVTATVNPLPTVSLASVSPTSVCGSGQVTFSATASSGSIKWYDALTGGNEISVLNPTISSTTTYYAEAISSEGCISAARTAVTAIVNTLPTVSSASLSPTSVCGSGQVTFSATASSGSIKWYDALTGGNEISVLNPTISSTTTYYAEAISSEGCISAARTAVTAIVNTLPTVSSASVSPTSVCGSGQVTFSATASSGSIKWYDALTGGNEISVLNPTISSTTTYYAEAISSEGCISFSRTGVTAIVNTLPTANITGDTSPCNKTTDEVYDTEAGMSNYNWSISSGGTITPGVEPNSITVSWNSDGDQWVSVNYNNGNGCLGSATLTIKVDPLPNPGTFITE